MGCNICNSGREGYKWSKDLILGVKTPRDAALKFKMEIDAVLEHMESHDMKKPSGEETELDLIVNDPQYLLKKAAKCILKLEDWIELTTETDDDSLKNMMQGTKLLKEFRETLKFIAELQGKFNKGDTYHQQFVQIQGDFNQFTTQVLESISEYPECQMKVLNTLKQLKGGINS